MTYDELFNEACADAKRARDTICKTQIEWLVDLVKEAKTSYRMLTQLHDNYDYAADQLEFLAGVFRRRAGEFEDRAKRCKR